MKLTETAQVLALCKLLSIEAAKPLWIFITATMDWK